MLGELLRKTLGMITYTLRFYVGKGQRLVPHPRLRAFLFRLCGAKIGERVRLEDLVIGNQAAWGFNNLTICAYTALTNDAKLDLTDKIYIGKRCVVAGSIYTHQDAGSLLFDSPTVTRYPRKTAPVTIKDNVYIATGAIILCGVNLGENSVVAAGSVVTSNVPPNTLVGGVPAKVIKVFSD